MLVQIFSKCFELALRPPTRGLTYMSWFYLMTTTFADNGVAASSPHVEEAEGPYPQRIDPLNLPQAHAVILLSASVEARNQPMGFARIEQAHCGHGPCVTPGVAVDHETRCADRNVQRSRSAVVRDNGADRVLGFRPWDMVE